MDANVIGDGLHRSAKLAMDSGEAATVEDALRLFEGYRLRIDVGSDIAWSPTLQAALLTAVNAGRRCFLGGVEVTGCLEAELLIQWMDCRSIAEAIRTLQGSITDEPDIAAPRIVIGDVQKGYSESEFQMRATFDGWRGGVIPLDDPSRLSERGEFTPAGVLAGGLAVSEAFQFVRGRNALAGRRDVGLSLWRPDSEKSWLDDSELGPVLDLLPSKLWLIGLGHLGQAYLWTLGFLPYRDARDCSFVLQDYDSLVSANDSTSLLTDWQIVGQKKTRAMANWCEERGFGTRILERRFSADFRLNDEEPVVALCGVDNEGARADLEDVGFSQVIEAGIGTGSEEYLAFQMHSFPSSRSARSHWSASSSGREVDSIISQPAYQSLAAEGLEQCGLTTLAGRSVGAAFVGATVSAIVIAELLRMCLGEQRYQVIDGSLRSLEHHLAILSDGSFPPFNPGLTNAKAPFSVETTCGSRRVLI